MKLARGKLKTSQSSVLIGHNQWNSTKKKEDFSTSNDELKVCVIKSQKVNIQKF